MQKKSPKKTSGFFYLVNLAGEGTLNFWGGSFFEEKPSG